MKKLLFTILFLLFVLNVSAQSNYRLSARCQNTREYTTLEIVRLGDIVATPCTNRSILFSNLSNSFKLQDINYVPFAGVLNADVLFSNASNNNVQNDAGLILTSNNFVGMANDLKITASGLDKWHIGFVNQIRSGGSYTGSGQLIGIYNFVNNRGNLTATPYVTGIYSSINLEGNATEAVGADISAFRGSAVTNPLFIGGRFTAANGYTNATNVYGVQSIVRTVSSGATITNGRALFGQFVVTFGHTVTNANGLFIGDWTNTGTIENSKAIYIDNSSNVGTVTNFAIASDSTAPSYFTGDLKANSGFYLYDSGTATVKQVTLMANDSCGAGFKCLKVAN